MHRIDGTLGSTGFGLCGVAVGIPSLRYWNSNLTFESRRGTLLGGQFDWRGRLLKSNGGVGKVSLSLNGNQARECKRRSEPNCETDGSSSNESWSLVIRWYVSGNAIAQQDKSYPGDNRLISPKSPHRRGGLAPRCRLIASWGCIRSQGFGCSPIKAVRELGSERRETVRSLSVVGAGYLMGSVPSTRGPGWTYLWRTSCSAKGIAGQLCTDRINAESI